MTLSRKKWKADSIVAIKDSTSVPVLILWTVISVTVSLLCCWSYLHPAWTVRSSYSPVGGKSVTDATMARRPLVRSAIPLVQIGLHSMCIYSHRQRFDTATCVSHAHLDDEWLPATWQMTRVSYGVGCFLLLVGSASSVFLLFQNHLQKCITQVTAIVQLIAAVLMLFGLCFYPSGLHNENLNQLCNNRCHPGWASLVSALAAVAALACPVLASLVSKPIYDATPCQAYLLL